MGKYGSKKDMIKQKPPAPKQPIASVFMMIMTVISSFIVVKDKKDVPQNNQFTKKRRVLGMGIQIGVCNSWSGAKTLFYSFRPKLMNAIIALRIS